MKKLILLASIALGTNASAQLILPELSPRGELSTPYENDEAPE